MDHNQTIVDLYLQKVLSTEPRIIAVDLYAAVNAQLNPKLDIMEFRTALKEWFNGPLNAFESVKGRFGGIRLRSEESRAERTESDSKEKEIKEVSTDPETSEDAGLVIYLSTNVRLHQPDSRQWALQKRNGDMWISQYYQSTLDGIISSYIRRSLNGEFKASSEKLSDLKQVIKLIQSVKAELEGSFKAVVVEKVA